MRPPEALRRAWARLKAATASASCSVAQDRFGALGSRVCPRTIDLITELGNVAEDADLVVADLHEATVHGDVELLAVGQGDPGVVLRERPEKWGMTRQEGDLASTEGAGDHLRRLTGEDHLLR